MGYGCMVMDGYGLWLWIYGYDFEKVWLWMVMGWSRCLLNWMLRYIVGHILVFMTGRKFSFMTSVDDENLSYAYMGPMP